MMPDKLTMICVNRLLENLGRPEMGGERQGDAARQKISSECCPHTIAGQNTGDFNPVHST